ncbi:hypothetical protein CTAYLR_004037 [Chrysophaeum taylorii]|uniref:Uncharacterized protein n=1 Tax=Chrysophaeum taylorii TaxID=2483200 RepID=A0AAD7U762_9STRA|nr:hypothetical protein CTAYLR_004037 [Chrysophaeum taylorii]
MIRGVVLIVAAAVVFAASVAVIAVAPMMTTLDMVPGPSDDVIQSMYNHALDCSFVDDDKFDWGTRVCARGDSYTCAEYSHPARIWAACNSTCNSYAMKRIERDIAEADDYHWDSERHFNDSWWVVCEWEAIKRLPELCNGTFHPSFPESSRNVDPSEHERYEMVLPDTTWDSCNSHAFCTVGLEDDGSLATYVRAVVEHYSWVASPGVAKENVFKYFDKWCAAGVLAAIDDGSFDPTAQSKDWPKLYPSS